MSRWETGWSWLLCIARLNLVCCRYWIIWSFHHRVKYFNNEHQRNRSKVFVDQTLTNTRWTPTIIYKWLRNVNTTAGLLITKLKWKFLFLRIFGKLWFWEKLIICGLCATCWMTMRTYDLHSLISFRSRITDIKKSFVCSIYFAFRTDWFPPLFSVL